MNPRDRGNLPAIDPWLGRMRCGMLVLAVVAIGCGRTDDRRVITLWHQMVPVERTFLEAEISRFEQTHPDLRVRTLFKETEELRSGFQAAVLANAGPELVFGPADTMGPYQAMGLIQDLSPWFSPSDRDDFLDQALTFLPARDGSGRMELTQVGDRVGNHLALVCNRRLLPNAPRTTQELIELAVANTKDTDGDGTTDQYGLVWNYTEPFFMIPFLTGYGGWVFERENPIQPSLRTPAMVSALSFITRLQNEYRVIPPGCDYEQADSLFKGGQAAMIINGDWSWGDYLDNDRLEAYIVPLPEVTATGLPMRPMSAAKGYSLNVRVRGEAAEDAIRFVKHMLAEDTQRRCLRALRVVPSRKSMAADEFLRNDATLSASIEQLRRSEPMPVIPELRAVWDGMRPKYQALLGGNATAEIAAAGMQSDAEQLISRMRRQPNPSRATRILLPLLSALVAGGLLWQRRQRLALAFTDIPRHPLPYAFVAPSLMVVAAAIVFPFAYNVVLSFSNMSLTHFRDWQLIGWRNYLDTLSTPGLGLVTLKTIVWTVVNVFFHVTIGLMLAVALHGVTWGKSIYRVLLIIPWAVPAYITALTWRGMFDSEFGLIPQATTAVGLPAFNWLNDPWGAFTACLLTNIWLGFPFMMIIALGGLQGIPRELYEAASIDRASRWRQFWHITLPMLAPVMIPAITLGTVWTFNNLNVVWLVSNGGQPSDSTHILVSYVYRAVFNLYQYGYGAALSLIIFGLILAVSLTLLGPTRATEGVAK